MHPGVIRKPFTTIVFTKQLIISFTVKSWLLRLELFKEVFLKCWHFLSFCKMSSEHFNKEFGLEMQKWNTHIHTHTHTHTPSWFTITELPSVSNEVSNKARNTLPNAPNLQLFFPWVKAKHFLKVPCSSTQDRTYLLFHFQKKFGF